MPDQLTDLGPLRVQFDNFQQTPRGRKIIPMMWVLLVTSILLVGVAIAFNVFIAGFDRPGIVRTMGVLLLVLAVFVVALAVGGLHQLRTCTASLHDQGISIRQPWFVNKQIRWSEVATLVAPGNNYLQSNFLVVGHDGKRTAVLRLSMTPHRAHDGTLIPHPDVATALNFFANWQHHHSQPPSTRPWT